VKRRDGVDKAESRGVRMKSVKEVPPRREQKGLLLTQNLRVRQGFRSRRPSSVQWSIGGTIRAKKSVSDFGSHPFPFDSGVALRR